MGTGVEGNDLPEPWFPDRRPNGKNQRHGRASTDVTTIQDSTTVKVVEKPVKRGRGRPKSTGNVVPARKGNKNAKALTPSSLDVVLGRSTNLVQDANELQQKMAEDALACGRTVRTIGKPKNPRTFPLATAFDSSTVDCHANNRPSLNFGGRPSSPTTSPLPASIEKNKKVGDDIEFLQGDNEETESSFLQRPGKEILANDNQPRLLRPKRKDLNVQGQQMELEMDIDDNSAGRHGRGEVQRQRRSSSPPIKYFDDHYHRSEVLRSKSPQQGCISYRGRSVQSPSQKNWSDVNQVHEYTGPQRSRSRSPKHWREDGPDRRGHRFRGYYEDHCLADQFFYECETSTRSSSRDRQRRRQNESSYPEVIPLHTRYDSPEDNGGLSKRSCIPYSLMSPPEMPPTSNASTVKRSSGFATMKEAKLVDLSPTLDRKQRRCRQAVRESEACKREKDGKKPFYLMLDPEGRPYGPGKPAWIAEINKLATGLDPSCTHIKKQTYEAIQTFKDRLNDNFEYSGTLNEDHLRGLMGRAVMKRRGELISFIRNNGKQPLNMDTDIWQRLENLANSKQREEKSEQGHYANSCRKTVGRTGSLGVNGVREKLRSILRRSPDPDKLEEEVQRDKGYGGLKRKRSSPSVQFGQSYREVQMSPRNYSSQEHGEEGDQSLSDEDSVQYYKCRGSHLPQSQRSNEFGTPELDVCTGRTIIGSKNAVDSETEKNSKDDYIAKLEDEIRRLKAKKVKVLTSIPGSPSHSEISKRY